MVRKTAAGMNWGRVIWGGLVGLACALLAALCLSGLSWNDPLFYIWGILLVGFPGALFGVVYVLLGSKQVLLRDPPMRVQDPSSLTCELGQRLLALPDWAQDQAWVLIGGRVKQEHQVEVLIEVGEALVGLRELGEEEHALCNCDSHDCPIHVRTTESD